MKKAFAYYRVSTEEQAKTGISLEVQKRRCREWAKNNKHVIIQEFEDAGKSGSSPKREALVNLITMIESSTHTVDTLIIVHTDRLARNIEIHLYLTKLLSKHCIQLMSLDQPNRDDTPSGIFNDRLYALMNEQKSLETSWKTSNALAEKAKTGWFPGQPPLGYINIQNPDPTSKIDERIIGLDRKSAKHIQKAFELYATGTKSLKAIAEYLTSKGVKPRRGNSIHKNSARGMLTNPFYLGKLKWGGEILQGKHKPLISEELFNRVQLVLAEHNKYANRKRKHFFLLRGFLYSKDNVRYSAGKHKGEYDHYFNPEDSKGTYVEIGKLENQVELIFQNIEITKNYAKYVMNLAKTFVKDARSVTDSQKQSLVNEKVSKEKAIREAEDDRYVHRTIDAERFKTLITRFENELAVVEEKIKNVSKDYKSRLDELSRLVRMVENIGQAYKEASPAIKRNYLSIFFENFTVEGEKIVDFKLKEDIAGLVEEGSVLIKSQWGG